MGSPWRTGLNESVSQLGPGLDYTSVNLWEAAVQGNHTAAGDSTTHVLEVQAHASDQAWTISGSINDADHPMIIRGHVAHRHHGIPGPGFAGFANTTVTHAIWLADSFVFIQGLVVSHAVNSAGNMHAIRIETGGDHAQIVDMLIANVVNTGTGTSRGISNSGANLIVVNTLLHNNQNIGFYNLNINSSLLCNVTATGNNQGGITNAGSGSVIAINCLATGNTGSQFGGTFAAGSTENVSSDATAPGTNPVINASVGYVDALNDNFHLTEADRAAIGTGADLSTDPTFPFDRDIDRATILTWYPGFDSINAPRLFTQADIQHVLRLPIIPEVVGASSGGSGGSVIRRRRRY